MSIGHLNENLILRYWTAAFLSIHRQNIVTAHTVAATSLAV